MAVSTVTAIVPAKGTSSRVPGKNMRDFAGRPLLQVKVEQLLACPRVDEVVVGSDDERVLELARQLGATPMLRDEYHCDETRCPANDMLYDLARRATGDVVLWAHCTNPLVQPKTYAAAVSAYEDGLANGYDSLMSVTKLRGHFWRGDETPLNFTPLANPHPLASSLQPLFAQDGAIFIQSREQMVRLRYFYGARPLMFELDAYEGLDINWEADFRVAESLAALAAKG